MNPVVLLVGLLAGALILMAAREFALAGASGEGRPPATVTGAGSIKYKGDPTVDEKNTGIGSIKPL